MTIAAEKPTWRERIAFLGERRVFVMLLLGFSSGLPLLLVFGTLSAWLRGAGVSRTEIGLLSWVALAYSFKFVWAPVVDRFDVPVLARLLGRRRAWMIVAQLTVAAGLLLIGLSDPATSLGLTVAGAMLTAFAGATQDIVVDGWRIDAAPTEKQGTMAATYQLGYRFALMASGAGALYIAEFVDWQAAYWTMAGLVSVGITAVLLAPVVDRDRPDRTGGFSVREAVVEPFADLVRRYGLALLVILPVVALYRLPDFIAGVMANPLYIDVGFSLAEIANVSKIYGVWIGLAGAFAGGLLLPVIGMRAALVIGALTGAGSNVMFAWLAHAGADIVLLTLAISVDNFSAGFAGSVLIAYMSGLTGPGFAATQYALLSSLYALPGKLVAGLSGVMVDAWGYPAFFIATSCVGIPVAILAWFAANTVARETQPAAVPAARTG
jgi:PAT family beta-lactamase induction signal transducer AmpG